MGCTVQELQERMTAREFVQWQAYYNINPFGPERGDMQAAVGACVTANVNRGKSTKEYRVSDFVLSFETPKQQTLEQQRALVFAAAMNARRK